MSAIIITGEGIGIEDVAAVARAAAQGQVAPQALERVRTRARSSIASPLPASRSTG